MAGDLNQLQTQSEWVDNQARSITSDSKILSLRVEPANLGPCRRVLVDGERGGAFVKRRRLYNEGSWLIVGAIMVIQHFP